MKYLLVFAVLWIAIWLWRKNRREEMQERAASKPRPSATPVGAPQEMVRCAHCGLHLPAADAIRGPGQDGAAYCSAAHREAAARG